MPLRAYYEREKAHAHTLRVIGETHGAGGQRSRRPFLPLLTAVDDARDERRRPPCRSVLDADDKSV